MSNKWRFAAGLAICLAMPGLAWADEIARKYGVEDLIVSPEESDADQAYGGFPNSRFFNNETKCSAVVSLFKAPGVSPSDPKMRSFLIYARVKLMEVDLAFHAINHTDLQVDRVEPSVWKALPALYPQYCRQHPHDTLEDATAGVYKAVSVGNAN